MKTVDYKTKIELYYETKGSPTEHAWLKMNQIRSNSFYKLFPKEIFQEEISGLKEKILNRVGTES